MKSSKRVAPVFWLLVAAICLFFLFVRVDAFDRVHVLIHERPEFNLGNLIIAVAIFLVGVAVLYFVDATRLKSRIVRDERATAASRESEARFRAMFDNSPHSMYLLDADGRFLLANREFQKRFGVSSHEVLGKAAGDFQPEPVASFYQAANREVIEHGRTVQGTIRQTYPDGATRTNLVVKFPVRDAAGRPVQIGAINTDITEIERARSAQRESEGRFRAVFEQAAVGVAVADLSSRFVSVNRKFAEILGYDADEMVGMAIESVTHPDFHRDDINRRPRIVAGEIDSYDIEKRYIRKDGRVIWGRVTVSMIRDAEGEPLNYIAVLVDITDRREAEEALRESEERYRRLVEVSPDGVMVHTDGIVTFANTAMARILGAPDPDAIIGREAITFVPEADRKTVLERRAAAANAAAAPTMRFRETTCCRLDGSEIPVERVAASISWKGTPSFLVLTRDISERIQARQALTESERRFREFAESLPEIVHETDAQGIVTFHNRQSLAITGYDAEDYAKGLSAFDLMVPEDRERVSANFSRVVAGEAVGPTEYRLRRKNGSTIPVLVHAAPVIRDGRIEGTRAMIFDISARKAMEEALRESEAQLRLITDAVPALIAYVDRDRRVRFANKAFAEWFDISRDAAIGMDIRNIRGPDAYDTDWIRIERVFDGEQVTFEGTRTVGDETLHYFATHIPHFGPDGEVLGYFALVLDVTDMKRADEAIRESEQRLIHAQRIARVGSFERSLNGDWVHWSEEMFRILGLETDTIAPSIDGFVDRVHPDDRERVRTAIATSLADRTPYEFECRILRPDGEERIVRDIAQVEPDDTGRPARVRGALLDVTEMRRSERARRETDARFLGVVENSPAAIYLKDLDGRFVLVNKRFTEWYGVSAEAVVGMTSYDVYPSEFADQYVAQDREVLESGETRERELSVPFADGTLHSILVTKFPVLAPDGKAIGVGTINTDVTDQRTAEAQLRQAQKMEAVGQLTGGVAHDFNNLLTVVLGNLELLGSRVASDPSATRHVETALRAVRRGSDLTQHLLAFSRRQPLSPTPTDVNRLVGGMTELLHRTLGGAIEIETVQSPGLCRAMVDAAQLENAVLNLALNARDAMPDGGKLIIETANVDLDRDYALTQSELAPGRYVMIAVSDTGVGIAPGDVDRVFEPFFTTKGEGKGTGLGLSMVFGFAKQSGGHVNIYSEPGQGTTVRIYLPRTEAGMTDEAPGDTGAPDGRGETILVVEDDPDVRAYVVTVLHGHGYSVLEAGDGPAALATLDAAPDVAMLFTDVVLPGGMNGRVIAEEARKRRPDIKVLFTSGYAENAVIHQGRLDDGVDLIAKPYTQDVLTQRVRSVLDAGH